MIKSIRLVNFKNFADEALRVGPFTVIVGANASGKSNIRDAFRFLHGIGRGYSLAEIIGGKYGADWKPIRGAANEIVRFGQAAFSIEVRMELEDADACYLIEVSNDKERPNEFRFTKEELTGVFKPDIFANMRFLELSPDQMREPAFPGATVLGDSGENLPSGTRGNLRRPQAQRDSRRLAKRTHTHGCGRLRVPARPQRSGSSHALRGKRQKGIGL